MNQETYSTGSVIIEEGSRGDCAYIIDKGNVEISVHRGGKKHILAILGEGDIFGEMALIQDDLRSATVTALRDVAVSRIGKDYFQDKLTSADPLISLLVKVLLERFHEARGKLLCLPAAYLTLVRPMDYPSCPRIYEAERRDTVNRLRLIEDLHSALKHRQLRLFYQPIKVLRDGRWAGFEALIRWLHPTLGLLSPSDFISLAEDAKDIIPIGYWVFETALNALRQLREAIGAKPGAVEPWMSINVSVTQLKDEKLIDRFAELLAKIDVPPAAVKIEITESVLAETADQALVFLHGVKRLGMKTAIDDFGTGYSSLSYLHLLPIDVLKIDRSFIVNMLSDRRSLEIVHAIVFLSDNLDIDLIAEGVDSPKAEALLNRLGCRYGQGNLYSGPLSLAESREWLVHSVRG